MTNSSSPHFLNIPSCSHVSKISLLTSRIRNTSLLPFSSRDPLLLTYKLFFHFLSRSSSFLSLTLMFLYLPTWNLMHKTCMVTIDQSRSCRVSLTDPCRVSLPCSCLRCLQNWILAVLESQEQYQSHTTRTSKLNSVGARPLEHISSSGSFATDMDSRPSSQERKDSSALAKLLPLMPARYCFVDL